MAHLLSSHLVFFGSTDFRFWFLTSYCSADDEKRWDAEPDHLREEVKELGRSKWSNDLDDDDTEKIDGRNGHSNALSGLIQAYAKEGKSVRWMDQVCIELIFSLLMGHLKFSLMKSMPNVSTFHVHKSAFPLILHHSFFQVRNTGFSIGAAKKANRLSLVIGPGPGYNLVSHLIPFVKLKSCVVEL